MQILNKKQIASVSGGEWVSCFCDNGNEAAKVLGSSGCHIHCCWNRQSIFWVATGTESGKNSRGYCEKKFDTTGIGDMTSRFSMMVIS